MVAEASAVATQTASIATQTAQQVSQYALASASLVADAVCNHTTSAVDPSASATAADSGWEHALPSLGNLSSIVVAVACDDDAELLRDALIAAAVLLVLLNGCCCCCRRRRHSVRNVRPRPRKGATRMVDEEEGDEGDWEAPTPSSTTRSQGVRSVQQLAKAKAQRCGAAVRSSRAVDNDGDVEEEEDDDEEGALPVGGGRRRERGALEMHRLPGRPHVSTLD